MRKFGPLQLLLICLGYSIGCGGNARSPIAVEDNIQEVISWAEKCGIHVSTGVLEVTIGRLDVPVGDEWIAEGRAIPGAEDILLELLEQKDERLHLVLAVQGLGFVGTAKCVPVLAELVKEDPGDYYAVCSLSELALPECVQPLASCLYLGGSLRTARYYAAEGLAKIGNAVAIEALEGALLEIQEEERRLEEALAKARKQQNESEGAIQKSSSPEE